MVDNGGEGGLQSVPIVWQIDSGPAPMVNQFMLQAVVDADGGPGEIVVNAGYVVPPAFTPAEGDVTDIQQGAVAVTNVARFSLSRHRAKQLMQFLSEQIDQWDAGDAIVRRGSDS